ncbi:hypothetical protein, partial [Ferruginibacter sp.]|uniref:hypothetical protein n=1 Tax=Ferruginibacter sp. TaxID=1940288 RepID=UPI00374DE844
RLLKAAFIQQKYEACYSSNYVLQECIKNGDRNLQTACCKLIRIAGRTYTGRCNNGQDDSKKALP